MNHSVLVGLAFGTTSGIITTLGLMTGLVAGTHMRAAVIGGVITIAIADSLSDALGIHVSEESEGVHTQREIWTATLSTFAAKASVAGSFLPALLFLELQSAFYVNLGWGALLLTVLSWWMAADSKSSPLKAIVEHVGLAAFVVVATWFVGDWVRGLF